MPKKDVVLYTQPYESALEARVFELGMEALAASPAGTDSAMSVAEQAMAEPGKLDFYHSIVLALGLAELRHRGPEIMYARACRLIGWKVAIGRGLGRSAANVPTGKLLCEIDPPLSPMRTTPKIDPENARSIAEGEWKVWPSYRAVAWEEW